MSHSSGDNLEAECQYCKNEVPRANLHMHELYCRRHLRVCDVCRETVPINSLDEHMESEHREVSCSMCSSPVPRNKLLSHMEFECSQRRVLCSYCDLKYPFVEFGDHKEVCGSRTDKCEKCLKTVMLKNMLLHQSSGCSSYAIESRRPVPKPRDVSSSFYTSLDNEYTPTSLSYHYSSIPRQRDMRGRHFNNVSAQSGPLLSEETGHAESLVGSSASDQVNKDELKLPCEFCEKLILAESLDHHQQSCPKRPSEVAHSVRPRPAAQHQTNEFNNSDRDNLVVNSNSPAVDDQSIALSNESSLTYGHTRRNQQVTNPLLSLFGGSSYSSNSSAAPPARAGGFGPPARVDGFGPPAQTNSRHRAPYYSSPSVQPPPYDYDDSPVPTVFTCPPNCACGRGNNPIDLENEEFVECSVCGFPVALPDLTHHEYYCQLKKEGKYPPPRQLMLIKFYPPNSVRDGRPALTDQAELPPDEDIQDNHHLQDRSSGTNHGEQVCCEYCGNAFYADELESHQRSCDESEPKTLIPSHFANEKKDGAKGSHVVPATSTLRDIIRQWNNTDGESVNGHSSAPGEPRDAPGILSEAPGRLSEAPGTLSEAPGTLSEAPGRLSEAPGRLSEAPGRLSDVSVEDKSAQDSDKLTPQCQYCKEEFSFDSLEAHEDTCDSKDFQTMIPITTSKQTEREKFQSKAEADAAAMETVTQTGSTSKSSKNENSASSSNLNVDEMMFPCSYCSQRFHNASLMGHMIQCTKNPSNMSQDFTSESQKPQSLKGSEAEDEMRKEKSAKRVKVLRETTESEKTEEVDTFPCEFCLKSFPRSDLDNHMDFYCDEYAKIRDRIFKKRIAYQEQIAANKEQQKQQERFRAKENMATRKYENTNELPFKSPSGQYSKLKVDLGEHQEKRDNEINAKIYMLGSRTELEVNEPPQQQGSYSFKPLESEYVNLDTSCPGAVNRQVNHKLTVDMDCDDYNDDDDVIMGGDTGQPSIVGNSSSPPASNSLTSMSSFGESQHYSYGSGSTSMMSTMNAYEDSLDTMTSEYYPEEQPSTISPSESGCRFSADDYSLAKNVAAEHMSEDGKEWAGPMSLRHSVGPEATIDNRISESMHAMSLRDADPEVIDELADCQYCGENVELQLLDNHEEKCAAKNEGQSKEDFQHYSAANAKGNAKTKAVKENKSRFKNSSDNFGKHKTGALQRSRKPVNKNKRGIDTEDKPRFPHHHL